MNKKYNTEEERKAAHNESSKRSYLKKREKVLKYKKEYGETHKEEKKEYNHNYNIEHREKLTEKKRVLRNNNPEKYSEIWRKYHETNKEERNLKHRAYWKTYKEANRNQILEKSRIYESENRDELNARKRKKYNENIEAMREKRVIYFKKYYYTTSGKANYRKYAKCRRALGYSPINSSFEGSHYHHLHLNGNKSIGLFIPSDIHYSIPHNGKTGNGMKEMNKAALLWLCDQSVIFPDRETQKKY